MTEATATTTMMPNHTVLKNVGPPDSPMSVGLVVPTMKAIVRYARAFIRIVVVEFCVGERH